MPAGPTHRIQIKDNQPRIAETRATMATFLLPGLSLLGAHTVSPHRQLTELPAGPGPFQDSKKRMSIVPAEAADNAVGRVLLCLLHGPPKPDPSASMIQEGRHCSCCWSHDHPSQVSQPRHHPGIQLFQTILPHYSAEHSSSISFLRLCAL